MIQPGSAVPSECGVALAVCVCTPSVQTQARAQDWTTPGEPQEEVGAQRVAVFFWREDPTGVSSLASPL